MPLTASASGLEGQTIDAGRLLLVRILGEGAYGVVYLAVDQHQRPSAGSSYVHPKEYAVKVLAKVDSSTPVGQCQSREVVAHKIVSDHPSVLTLHDVLEDDQFIFLVLDYCPGGDLYNAIVERQTYYGKDTLVKSVFVQILDAVKSCHDLGIYHRDIKPDNVFVSEDDLKVYLGDFGLSTDQNMSMNHKCGSSYYMSPECIGEEHNFLPFLNQVNDVWSLGIIFTNLITGRNPWRRATTDDEHFHRYICDPDAFLRNMLPMSTAAGEIFKRIFTFNPVKRISLEQLREAVLAIDTFFPSPDEEDSVVREDKSVSDIKPAAVDAGKPRTSPATPQLPQGVAEDFTKLGAYPSNEFIFSSPDLDASYVLPSSQFTTPSTVFSSSSTLCDDDVNVFDMAHGGYKLDGREDEMEDLVAPDSPAAKTADRAVAAAYRMLERLMI